MSIPWFGVKVGEAEKRYLNEVIDSGYINDGPFVRDLEKRLADFLGVPFALTVTSGTAAISLALLAVGIAPGDEVLVPNLTFIATANAARLIGAKVVFCDVGPERMNVTVANLEKSWTPRVRAIVTVDVNGRSCDYTAIETWARGKGLPVICDSAEAFGSVYNGKSIGSRGEMGCFSFSANKTISSGQGGLIVTKKQNLYHRLLELKDQGRRAGGSGGADLHPVFGSNFKYTSLQGAVLRAQLERAGERIKRAQDRDQLYLKLLKDCPGISLPAVEAGEVLQWTDLVSPRRAELIAAFQREGIGFREFWLPITTQEPYRDEPAKYPVSHAISQNGMWLPSHFDLTDQQIKMACAVIQRTLS